MSRIISSRPDSRHKKYTDQSSVYASISQQLRQLREETGLSQAAVGRLAEMAPERISILEDPKSKTKPTVATLLRLAEVFEVDLEVRFIKREINQSSEYPVKTYSHPWDYLMGPQGQYQR